MNRIFVIICMAVLALGSNAQEASRRAATGSDNFLSMDELSIKQGDTQTVSVNLTNTEGIQGTQFDIILPEGLSLATKSNGNLDIANVEERAEGFSLSSSLLEGGVLRVTTVNMDGNTYTGNAGAILTFKVTADVNMSEGEYEMNLKNVVLSNGEIPIKPEDKTAKVTVLASPYILGDANGDGKVTITDAVTVVNYILGNPSNDFVFNAADVNGDKKITITDAVGVVNIILGAGSPASARAFSIDKENVAEPE